MSSDGAASGRGRLAGRWIVPAVLGIGLCGGSLASGDIIFSNYGPGMTYNTDETSAPLDGGAYLGFDGALGNGQGSLNEYTLASFVTPDETFLPTQITLAVDTYQSEHVYIVPDINGTPAEIDGSFLAESGAYGTPLNGNLNGFIEVKGNTTATLQPAVDENADDTDLIPRLLQPNTRYWVAVEQDYEKFNYGLDDARSESFWYQSIDTNAPADSVYTRSLPAVGGNEGEFINAAQPVFQLEGTVVPEPTSACGLLLAGTIGLSRRVHGKDKRRA